jgi:TolA-binding protein
VTVPDDWLPALIGATPQIGIAAFLAWLLLRVWDRASSDRTSYEQGMQDAQSRYATALEAAHARHEADMQKMREQVERLSARVEELHTQLDEERAARRAAQDAAWRRMGGERM